MKYLVVFLCGFYLYAQELPVIYVDENFQKIPEELYNTKQESNIFLEAEIVSDTAIYKKLFFREFFGTLDKSKKSQLNKLLFQKYGIDSTKVWVIHYTDSLPDVSTLSKKSGIIYEPIDSTQASIEAAAYLNSNRTFVANKFSSKELNEKLNRTKHSHRFSYKSWYTSRKKEIKKFRKLDHAMLLHFYDHNAGFPESDRIVKWYKDPYKVLKIIFSDGVKNYPTIILHPDGDFFVSHSCSSIDKEKELTDKEFFEKEKKNKGFE